MGGIVGLNDAKESLMISDCVAICSVEGTNGGYIAATSCGTVIENTYCYDGVQITATSVCTEGTVAGGDKINSLAFYKDTLKWSDKIWQLADGGVPSLK